MRTRSGGKRVAVAALLVVSFAAPGRAQRPPTISSIRGQVKTTRPAEAAKAPSSVPMPKTDRMPMAVFKGLLAKGNVVVIDVRSSDNYASGHIPGALSIPEASITPATAEKLKRMGKPIATYCA